MEKKHKGLPVFEMEDGEVTKINLTTNPDCGVGFKKFECNTTGGIKSIHITQNMTPKEKAKQIYDKMYIEHDLHGFDYCDKCAKEHSLILIDEVILALNAGCASEGGFYNGDQFVEYWDNVKIELIKL